jgi:hypothetical protein
LYVVPIFHAGGDELTGQAKKNDGWKQRQGEKGDHQFSPKSVAKYVASAFEDEFDHVARDQINKEQQEDDINVHQSKNYDVAAHWEFAAKLEEVTLKVGKENYEYQRDDNDYSLSPPATLFPGAIWFLRSNHCLLNYKNLAQ